MLRKYIVIYCRYSTDMQWARQLREQERQVRAALARLGVCGFEIVVIYNEAESGTKTDRDGFRQLRDMVARGEIAVLAIDDQSRLTRAENANAFIQDLVFAGGLFVSTGETLPLRQVVLVGLLVGTACLVLPQTTAAVVGRIGATGTAVSVQVGNWLARAARRVGQLS